MLIQVFVGNLGSRQGSSGLLMRTSRVDTRTGGKGKRSERTEEACCHGVLSPLCVCLSVSVVCLSVSVSLLHACVCMSVCIHTAGKTHPRMAIGRMEFEAGADAQALHRNLERNYASCGEHLGLDLQPSWVRRRLCQLWAQARQKSTNKTSCLHPGREPRGQHLEESHSPRKRVQPQEEVK